MQRHNTQPGNKGGGTWQYFTLIIVHSVLYFIEKYANNADGKNNPLDMDITSKPR